MPIRTREAKPQYPGERPDEADQYIAAFVPEQTPPRR